MNSKIIDPRYEDTLSMDCGYPQYTKEIASIIVSMCDEGGLSKSLALDIACGKGNSTVCLAGHFSKVVGVDPNSTAIEAADRSAKNVLYRVGGAEDLSFQQDNSVDLVTIGSAAHLVDLEVFLAEVSRILKANGVFAEMGYGFPVLVLEEAQDVWSQFREQNIDVFFNEYQRQLIYADFKHVMLPFPLEKRYEEVFKYRCSLSQFINVVAHISACEELKQKRPTALHDLWTSLRNVYKKEYTEEDSMIEVAYRFHVNFTRKPSE